MGLGDDIKEVFEEIGTAFRIIKPSGRVFTGEYLDYEVNTRTSDPFHREFFLETELPYDTDAGAGDIIEFVQSGRKNIIVSRTAETFENEVTAYYCTAYKCNVSGELLRPFQQEREKYHYENVFSRIKDPCYGLLTNSNYNNYQETDEEYANFGIIEMFLYLPHAVGIQADDRYLAKSGEYFRVGAVRSYAFENTDMATLHQDHR